MCVSSYSDHLIYPLIVTDCRLPHHPGPVDGVRRQHGGHWDGRRHQGRRRHRRSPRWRRNSPGGGPVEDGRIVAEAAQPRVRRRGLHRVEGGGGRRGGRGVGRAQGRGGRLVRVGGEPGRGESSGVPPGQEFLNLLSGMYTCKWQKAFILTDLYRGAQNGAQNIVKKDPGRARQSR